MSKHPKQRIAVGIDGSENSRAAVKWAIEHARQGDTIVMVHVWHPYVYGTELATAFTIDNTAATELLEGEFVHFIPLAKEHEVMLKHDLIEGDARDTLNIPNIDLLVIGARGHSGIAGILLGSVADYITRHATVPVVVIPPESRTTAK